jgi:hypothetical protein
MITVGGGEGKHGGLPLAIVLLFFVLLRILLNITVLWLPH